MERGRRVSRQKEGIVFIHHVNIQSLFLATFLVNIAKEFLESNQTRNPSMGPKSS